MHSFFSFQHRALQTSSLLKLGTLQSPCMPTFLCIPCSGSYQVKRLNFRVPYFKNYSMSPLLPPSPKNKAKRGVGEIQFLLSTPRIQSSFTDHIINSMLLSLHTSPPPITENGMNRSQKVLIPSSGIH